MPKRKKERKNHHNNNNNEKKKKNTKAKTTKNLKTDSRTRLLARCFAGWSGGRGRRDGSNRWNREYVFGSKKYAPSSVPGAKAMVGNYFVQVTGVLFPQPGIERVLSKSAHSAGINTGRHYVNLRNHEDLVKFGRDWTLPERRGTKGLTVF